MTAAVLGLQADEFKKLHDVLSRAESSSDFDVLGLDQSATVKDIKRAYFELAALIHPDRFFGKDIGPWRGRLEQAYLRATRAHDALIGSVGRIAIAPAAPPPQEPPQPRMPVAAPSLADRRALLARKLGGARPAAPPAPDPAPSTTPSTRARAIISQPEFEELMSRSRASAKDNNWGQAFVFAQAAAGYKDVDAASLAWAADAGLRAKLQPALAVELATRAVGLAPKLQTAHLSLARAYEAAGRTDMAIRVATAGMALSLEKSDLVAFLETVRKKG